MQWAWSAEEPYAVIHRMAFQKEFRGIGLADIAFRLIEELCIRNGIYYIRVDTDF
ncbi:GNAT family N-acetyltransferase [Lachnospiraceae bacterium 48-21]